MRVSTAILALGSVTSAFAALTITAPSSINQCQDATFQVSGNTGTVMLSVVPSIDPCAHDALLQLGPFTPTGDGSFTWHNVNITSGTPVYVVADDDSDAEAWTQIITIGGNGQNCAASGSSSNTDAQRTTASVNNAAATGTTRPTNTNTNAPVNAGSPTGTSDTTSGAMSISVPGSPKIGVASLLAGAAVALFV